MSRAASTLFERSEPLTFARVGSILLLDGSFSIWGFLRAISSRGLWAWRPAGGPRRGGRGEKRWRGGVRKDGKEAKRLETDRSRRWAGGQNLLRGLGLAGSGVAVERFAQVGQELAAELGGQHGDRQQVLRIGFDPLAGGGQRRGRRPRQERAGPPTFRTHLSPHAMLSDSGGGPVRITQAFF